MKREILFRGKRVDNGEWVYGVPYERNGEVQMIRSKPVSVVPESICEYTGLIDENGVKIFEGDIVNCKSTGYFFFGYVVDWYAKCARWVIRKQCPFSMSEEFKYEIIGNIYDNPEWLEMQEETNG